MISNRSRLATYASVLVLLVSIVVIIGAKPVQRTTAKNQIAKRAKDHLVVHEWGTFTSIAGKNGVALEWKPLNGTSDLPSFVYDVGGLANSTKGRFATCETGAKSSTL